MRGERAIGALALQALALQALALGALLIAAVPQGAVAADIAAPGTPAARAHRMSQVKSWGYWLRAIDIEAIRAAPHDLIVTDYGLSDNHVHVRERTVEEIAAMKGRAGGGPDRLVIAYLSIGEAERYRPYWQASWYEPGKAPPWLGRANRQWAGNFAVRYWDPAWQRLILGSPDSYLERIIAQGFDGIYLDRADGFSDWEAGRPSAPAEMADFIVRLATHARRLNPGFLIIMQNAEELLPRRPLLEAIDAIAKEDLYYGIDHTQKANKASEVDWSMQHLKIAQAAGRRVLVVEYVTDAAKVADVARRSSAAGFVPYVAPRGLECLYPPPSPQGPVKPAAGQALGCR